MHSTPDPATATREELIALLMRAMDDTVALEKRLIVLEGGPEYPPVLEFQWVERRAEEYVIKPWWPS